MTMSAKARDAIEAGTWCGDVEAALMAERKAIADKAREYAEHYPPHSDGRNTFVLLAEWIEARS